MTPAGPRALLERCRGKPWTRIKKAVLASLLDRLDARDTRINELELEVYRVGKANDQLTRERDEARAELAEVKCHEELMGKADEIGKKLVDIAHAAGFAACREMALAIPWPVDPPHSHRWAMEKALRALKPPGGDDGEVG